MIRAFVAIDLPASVQTGVAVTQEKLRGALRKMSVAWTKPENLHLTLQFLGETPETNVTAVSAALGEVAGRHSVFPVAVGGVGAFPDLERPRVIWVGCEDRAGQLAALAADVRQAMTTLGYRLDEHPFTAHLTLGRVKSARPDGALTQALDSIKKDAVGTLRVEAIHLIQSQLSPGGSIYTKLSSHALRPDVADKGEHHHAAKS